VDGLQLTDEGNLQVVQEVLEIESVAVIGAVGLVRLGPREELLQHPDDRGVVAEGLPKGQFLLEFGVGAVSALPVGLRRGFAEQLLLAAD